MSTTSQPMNTFRLTSASLLAVYMFLPAGANADAPQYNTGTFATENATLLISVNGFPLYDLQPDGNFSSQSSLLGYYLKKGANELVVKATQQVAQGLPKPDSVFFLEIFGGDSIPNAKTSILRVDRILDTSTDEPNAKVSVRVGGEAQVELRYRGANDGGTVEFNQADNSLHHVPAQGATTTLRINLNLPNAALDSLPWIGVPPVIEAADEAAIKTAVIAYHSALNARDWNQVAILLDAKYERIATGSGLAKADVAGQTQATFVEVFASEGFTLEPLVAADLMIEPIPGLNLVKIKKGGLSPIRGSGTQFDYETPLYLSKITGNWVIVE